MPHVGVKSPQADHSSEALGNPDPYVSHGPLPSTMESEDLTPLDDPEDEAPALTLLAVRSDPVVEYVDVGTKKRVRLGFFFLILFSMCVMTSYIYIPVYFFCSFDRVSELPRPVGDPICLGFIPRRIPFCTRQSITRLWPRQNWIQVPLRL